MRAILLGLLVILPSCDSLVDWCMASGWKSPEQCEAMRSIGE